MFEVGSEEHLKCVNGVPTRLFFIFGSSSHGMSEKLAHRNVQLVKAIEAYLIKFLRCKL